MKILCLLTIAMGFMALNSLSNNTNDLVFMNLTALQCDSLITANDTNPYFAIIDVRTYNEYQPEHLKYAVNIDFYESSFEDVLNTLHKDKKYVIYCLSGGRSA